MAKRTVHRCNRPLPLRPPTPSFRYRSPTTRNPPRLTSLGPPSSSRITTSPTPRGASALSRRIPLAAWAEFSFDGLPIRVGKVVQTLQRVTGPGGIYDPLVVTPSIGIRVEPEARILPLDGGALPVRVTVHAQAATDGTVDLKLPAGWNSNPVGGAIPSQKRRRYRSNSLLRHPGCSQRGSLLHQGHCARGGHDYEKGWQPVGYPGLRPYNQYKPSTLLTRKADVKLAPGLRIGYVMGTGDLVPEAIEGMGVTPHLLTDAELASGRPLAMECHRHWHPRLLRTTRTDGCAAASR